MVNRATYYYENDKKRLRKQAKINTETYKIKIEKENMEKTDIIICLKKKSKN